MQIDKGAEDQQDSTNKSAPKVSTHGPRMSGREVWKASKRGIQLRRAPSTTVWHQRSTVSLMPLLGYKDPAKEATLQVLVIKAR
ncbi:hypothetical protein H4Q26_015636 [Puccinia striiformis f. sp. tritici PST-130]|nr:hypothetical protein H4Q26_015636 [Puccinia striiformis f. sp. tritici PST-130]